MGILDIHDDLGWFFGDNSFSRVPFGRFRSIEIIDPDDYVISPRKSFVERQIKEKEERLRELTEKKGNALRWFDEQEKTLLAEIGNLKTQLAKKIEKE